MSERRYWNENRREPHRHGTLDALAGGHLTGGHVTNLLGSLAGGHLTGGRIPGPLKLYYEVDLNFKLVRKLGIPVGVKCTGYRMHEVPPP